MGRDGSDVTAAGSVAAVPELVLLLAGLVAVGVDGLATGVELVEFALLTAFELVAL